MTSGEVTILILSPIIGVFITRLFLFFIVKPNIPNIGAKRILSAIFMFWTSKDFEQLLDE